MDLFLELGGELRLNCPVRHVAVGPGPRPRHRVATEAARRISTSSVSNADIHHTYAKLYGREPRAEASARRVARMDWSMSLAVIYFGTDRRYPDLAHHTILFGKRYRGLLDDIFGAKVLADDFSLYLHAPTVTDPSLAPPGGEAFYVLSPVPHLGTAPIGLGEGRPPPTRTAFWSRSSRTCRACGAAIVTRRVFTPADFASQLAAATAPRSRSRRRCRRAPTPAATTATPASPPLPRRGGDAPRRGRPGVVNSAKATAAVVARDFAR